MWGTMVIGKGSTWMPNETMAALSESRKKRTYANGSKSKASKAFRHNVSGLQHQQYLSTVTGNTSNNIDGDHSMLTRGITTSISRSAVFNTLELLENILSQLPMEDILTARHVNRHWNALILTSPRLQHILFLRPAPKHRFWVLDLTQGVLRKYKAGDKERFGPEWADRQSIVIPGRVNPLLFKENPPHYKACLVHRAKVCEGITLKASPDLTNQNSIFHKMLVALPPPKIVEFEFWYNREKPTRRSSRRTGESYVRTQAKNRNGVTFGDIIRKFQAKTRTDGAAQICVRASVLWMLGVMHPTEEEVETVEPLST